MKRRGNYQFLEKFSWYTPGLGGMFGLLAWLLVGGVLGSIVTLLLQAFGGPEAVKEYGNLLSYPVMFIPPMLYASVKSSRLSMDTDGFKLDSNNFAPVGGFLCAILAIVGTLSLAFWAEAIINLLPAMPKLLEDMLKSLTGGNFIINFITVSIFAPVCEEWLCRGMVLRGLLRKSRIKPFWAILISALFFAIIHLNPWQAVPALLMGCLFGYVYYRTGSLKLTMLMHCVNNSFALICGHIDALKDMDSWADVISEPLYGILIAATVILTALVVLAFRKVKLLSPEGSIDPVPSIFNSAE